MIGLFAAISAALAVAAGAFGAHGAAGPQEADWLRTGGLYQLVHAVAALAIMGNPADRRLAMGRLALLARLIVSLLSIPLRACRHRRVDLYCYGMNHCSSLARWRCMRSS